MPKRLEPSDIPQPASIQIAALDNGRLLLRGPAGVSVLGGVAREDLERVLARVDGERTAGEICDQLAGEYQAGDVLGLLRQLNGIGLHGEDPDGSRRDAGAPSEGVEDTGCAGSPLIVLGDGDAARRLAEILEVPRQGACHAPLQDLNVGSPAQAELDEHLRDCELVVCALEDAPYAAFFDVQRACLRAGAVGLFVTFDPDGTRIGPVAVPGASPCFACSQIASFRALRLEGPDLLAAVADFTTGIADTESLEPVAREVTRETRALLSPGGRPSLLTSVLLLSKTGRRTVYPVTPAADCPICGPAVAEAKAAAHPLAARAQSELVDAYRRSPRLASVADGGDLCTSVGVLGGGTAGWLTALALRRKLPHLAVTLIESSAVPIIGVGEATTPLMPQFLHVDLGLDVHELFREVAPTLKLGIRFDWGPPGRFFNYPFGPVHVLEPAVHDGDIRRCSAHSLLMSAGAVALHREDGAWHSDLDVDVAYHLDNQRFVRYLRSKAQDFGIETVDARIREVEVATDRDSVTGLVADDGRRFSFDLYVDCSGFRSLLLEKSLGSPFLGYADHLPTDRALVATVPHDGAIAPYTRAETLDAGWCWSTPQRDADHRGYVFCSAFASPDEAEREMRRANPGMGDPRLVEFRAGRHRHFWKGNVVAMGNAYGFVEPLESTALHMLIRQIGMFVAAFPVRRGERGTAGLLNRRVGAFWDYLRWFLALHYRFNRRLDSPFWRHCRREIDVSAHAELLKLFRERGPLSYQRQALTGFDYPDPLWGAEGIDVLLLGQAVPARLPRPAVGRQEWKQRTRLYHAVTERALPQALALEVLEAQPALLERWVAAFVRAGPAFRPLPGPPVVAP